jgi:tRNA/tmRNA/rRNA uracil-C5-methylase (TrmA/RlmC/RlmD family)
MSSIGGGGQTEPGDRRIKRNDLRDVVLMGTARRGSGRTYSAVEVFLELSLPTDEVEAIVAADHRRSCIGTSNSISELLEERVADRC